MLGDFAQDKMVLVDISKTSVFSSLAVSGIFFSCSYWDQKSQSAPPPPPQHNLPVWPR